MKVGRWPVVVAVVLCAANPAFAFGIRGFVIANGGRSATPATNGVYRSYGTIGQAAVGPAQGVAAQVCAGFWCFGGPRVLAAPPAGTAPPTEFALGPATPNPTRDAARFDLALPEAATVTLAVYDVSGRQVGDAIEQPFAAGRHQLTWRSPGARAGVYFVRLLTDGRLRARRAIVLVK